MSPHRRVSSIVAAMAALLVGAFVLTSSLVATLPQFRFESQFPALLPFFVWAAATGVGHLANLGRALHDPWRGAYGYASVAPYVLLMLASAAAPQVSLPWWLAVVAALAAMLPFVLLALRAGTKLSIDPARDADDASLRGTFTIGLARASRTWRLRHWASLALGSLVAWASVLVGGLTDLLDNPWVVLGAVLLGGLPLLVVNALEARRR